MPDEETPHASGGAASVSPTGRSAAERPTGWLSVTACLVLTAQAATVGLWAAFFPNSFFQDFPGVLGQRWFTEHDTYDEHLVRDVGTLHLALLVPTVGAIVKRVPDRLVGWMWVPMALPHAWFHANHLEGLAPSEQYATMAGLISVVAASVFLASRRKATHATSG
jgi:hypothetical protein